MHGIEFLMEYRNNSEIYLPMIDHERKVFPDKTDMGDVNIGWNCGFIDRRPFFMELWAADGITVLTVFVCTKGIENYSVDDLERLLIDEAQIYSKKPGYFTPQAPTCIDSNGNEFFSFNVVVGMPDEPAVIDGAKVYPFEALNELNSQD